MIETGEVWGEGVAYVVVGEDIVRDDKTNKRKDYICILFVPVVQFLCQ